MSVLKRCLALLLVWTCAAAAAQAATGHRVALVVGIGAYQHLPQLGNTVADAKLIADKLRETGFDVDLETDLTTDKLKLALRDFGRRIEAAGPDAVALLYYAGHGVQDDKQDNYLIGADADLRSQVDLPLEAMPLDAALQTLDAARPATTFVILDACRDDPLPVSDRRGGRRGLAVVPEQRGLLIAYSTEPGKTALDGPAGGHSPFAAALADELDKPGLEVTQLFKLVTKKVLDETHEEQFPWVTQRLVDDFYFRPGPQSEAGPAPAIVPEPGPSARPVGAAPQDQGDAGEVAYGEAVLENSAPGYEAWLRTYPNDKHKVSVLALLQRLREEELWRRSEAASTSEAVGILQTELMAFPDGVYADRARQRLNVLLAAPQTPDPSASPSPAAGPPSPSFNCAKAGTPIERQICASPALAAQDKQMADLFGQALARSTNPLDAQGRQTDWLRGRDACAGRDTSDAISACVASAYAGRIAVLQRLAATDTPPEAEQAPVMPSFNCAYARSAAEKLICDVPQLAAVDRALATLYADAARANPAVARAEGVWMKGRNACGGRPVRAEAIACILDAYRSRIAALGGVVPVVDGGSVAVSPSFDCNRAGHPVEKLICATPKLALDDQALAALFPRVRESVAAPSRLDLTQGAWLASRNDCGALLQRTDAVACVDQAYRRRIGELQAELR